MSTSRKHQRLSALMWRRASHLTIIALVMLTLTCEVAARVGGRDGLSAEAWLQQRASDCPLGRLAQPWEIAGVVAFLASSDADFITGVTIDVTGGLS